MIEFIRRARRRFLGNELLSQGANALSAALGALILLLLVGTQILNWQWTLAIPLAAAIAGVILARRRLPSLYAVAQLVDRRLSLADALSTAFFFSQNKDNSKASAEVRQLQYDRADRLSRTLDVRHAVPFRLPRTVYLSAALLLVASSLFALRYGLTRSLDLKPPLASILEQTLGEPRTAAAANHPRLPKQPDPEMEPDSSDANVQDPDRKAGDQADKDASNASEEASDPQSGESKSPNQDAQKPGEQGEQSDSQQNDAQGEDRSGDGDQSQGKKGDSKADAKQDSTGKQQSDNAGDSSSLMSRVKDAMQNLLSKMKPQQNQSASQQQQQQQTDQKSQSKSQQNGKPQSGKDGQQNGQQGDPQEGQSSDEAQNSQDPQGKGTGKSDNQQPSKQPGSGIGAQDGDKSIKQAEQTAAMGKISEIFGKRSANLTGEATLEVQNTSQTLRTQYTQRNAQHTQSGAEINRDEIPMALQPYITQYFEQVRKQQPKK